MSAALDDIDALARTCWGEARGEGLQGMEAVACVILNRARDKRWPDTIEAVCHQPKQFSCWNENDPNLRLLKEIDHNHDVFARAYAIAAMAVANMLHDRTGGANHYLAAWLFDGPSRPMWAREDAVTCRIGNHVFLKL